MTGIYYAELGDVLRDAGCAWAESDVNRGWETRARSSGGFPAPPLGVFWHHTASTAAPESDLSWMIHGSDDAPIGNLLLDRGGIFWPIAAGASNCAGKGGPWVFSRGVCPLDGGNTRGFQLEVANSGVGEPWPTVQIDAYFAGSNALNAYVGNLPSDVVTHAAWTDYSRKIDPATAASVLGPWRPGSLNTSGTWSLADVAHECERRSSPTIPKPPPTNGDLVYTFLDLTDVDAVLGGYMDPHGICAVAEWLNPERYAAMAALGAPTVEIPSAWCVNITLLGEIPHGLTPANFARVIT